MNKKTLFFNKINFDFKVTIDIDFKFREPIELAFTDLCNSFHQINTTTVKSFYTSQKLTTSIYLSLYSPALDWIVQCLLHKLDENKMQKIVKQTRAGLNIPRFELNNSLLISYFSLH